MRPWTDDHPVTAGSPYQGYVYAYPHKTAYRHFDPPRPLADVWAAERRDALFLYVHVPFCTMRCGFCNLFTQAKPTDSLVTLYLDVLRRQAEWVRECVPDARFARVCVGGGTPTFLSADQLAVVFAVAERVMGADVRAVPACVEASPDTISADKLAVLKARGVDRLSIGIQSFFPQETADCGRPQTREHVETALGLIADAGFPTVNLDLIYGLPGQTPATWRASLRAALAHRPAELFLYPLYVRPLTGLGRSHRQWDDDRLALYRLGRDLLLTEGYEQVSMRYFRRADAPDPTGPVYCCQTDGTIGLGCGARSYTRGLHYSLDYAVSAKGVRAVLADYVARDDASFGFAHHGFELDDGEQRRRFVLQSILNADGLDATRYAARFGCNPLDDIPPLAALLDLGLLTADADRLTPTAAGLERSDVIGPWLFSPAVRRRMAEYDLR